MTPPGCCGWHGCNGCTGFVTDEAKPSRCASCGHAALYHNLTATKAGGASIRSSSSAGAALCPGVPAAAAVIARGRTRCMFQDCQCEGFAVSAQSATCAGCGHAAVYH